MKNNFVKMKAPICMIFLLAILSVIFFNCKKKECMYDEYPYSCNKGMDVAFLIDYTGSMGGAIDSVKSQVSNIAAAIAAHSGGNYRLSLSIFDEYAKKTLPRYNTNTNYTSLPAAQKVTITTGPTTDQYLTMMEKFALSNTTSFSAQLAKLNGPMPLGSGAGTPEPGDLLLNEILNNNFAGTWRSGITKFAIIITDAPAGGNDDLNTTADDTYLANLATTANSMGIQCILLTTLNNSNYQLQLINNNLSGHAFVAPNFNTIAKDMINIIDNVCKDNAAD